MFCDCVSCLMLSLSDSYSCHKGYHRSSAVSALSSLSSGSIMLICKAAGSAFHFCFCNFSASVSQWCVDPMLLSSLYVCDSIVVSRFMFMHFALYFWVILFESSENNVLVISVFIVCASGYIICCQVSLTLISTGFFQNQILQLLSNLLEFSGTFLQNQSC